MKKIITTTYQDEMLILYLLADHNADIDTLQKEIMELSQNSIVLEQQYLGILLYQLRTDRLVQRTTNKRYEPMHEITEIGRQVLADHLAYYRQHDFGIHRILDAFSENKAE
ncbi:MAG: hypothetical protein IJV48_03395 [Ruminococcus sp.]|nr:hypothetical protein [Ruminococcus sp.]